MVYQLVYRRNPVPVTVRMVRFLERHRLVLPIASSLHFLAPVENRLARSLPGFKPLTSESAPRRTQPLASIELF
jgi:hypothetical protein